MFLGFKSQKTKSIGKNDIRLIPITQNGIKTTEYQFPVEIESYAVWDDRRFCWTRYRETLYGKTKNNAADIQAFSTELDTAIRKGEVVTLPLISYYGNGRLWLEPNKTSKSKKKVFSRFDGYTLSLDPRKSLADLEDWFRRQEQILFKEGSADPVFFIIKKAIIDALPGFSEINYDPRINQIYTIKDDGTRLPYTSLSDGQRGMLALIGDLAIRISTLNPHLGNNVLEKTPGVVLIDELDLYLHPQWQRIVSSVLQKTFPEIQFICTTHSPQVIGEIDGNRIYSLDHGKKLTEAYGLDSNTILEDVMQSMPRSEKVFKKYEELEVLISEEKFAEAEALIKELTSLIKGIDSSLNRLITIMENMKALNSAD